MRLRHAILSIMPLLLAGCGSSSSRTLSVSCGGSLSVAGAVSIEVSPNSAGEAVLKYPDPVTDGKTSTLPIKQGARCTITPTANV
jgi:hypothetical protein